jgi:hypothetical protein
MKTRVLRVVLGIMAVLFALLTWAVTADAARAYERLTRLRTESRRVAGTIVSIEVEPIRPAGEPRSRSETWRLARVRYEVDGVTYMPVERHMLAGDTLRLGVGDSYPLLVLPDDAGHPIAPNEIAGSWIALFYQPVLLGAVSALALLGAWRLRTRTSGD